MRIVVQCFLIGGAMAVLAMGCGAKRGLPPQPQAQGGGVAKPDGRIPICGKVASVEPIAAFLGRLRAHVRQFGLGSACVGTPMGLEGAETPQEDEGRSYREGNYVRQEGQITFSVRTVDGKVAAVSAHGSGLIPPRDVAAMDAALPACRELVEDMQVAYGRGDVMVLRSPQSTGTVDGIKQRSVFYPRCFINLGTKGPILGSVRLDAGSVLPPAKVPRGGAVDVEFHVRDAQDDRNGD